MISDVFIVQLVRKVIIHGAIKSGSDLRSLRRVPDHISAER